MMAARLLLLLAAFATVGAGAADFDPRAFGAKGDGVAKDTAAIQRAIDTCVAAGGGRVVLTNGIFLTAPIVLGSGVELHLAKGATLLGSADLADYPNRNVEGLVNEWMPRARNTSLVFAAHARNVSITGEGTIDANGRRFVVRKQEPDWTGWEYVRKVDITKSMPRVVFFFACRGVRVTDVTLTNGPAGWSYWVHDCDDVLFDRCKVKVNVAYPNNDGIHINSSRDVIVRNCDLETGDDSIIVRANNHSLARAENPVCERVVVSNCVLRSWSSGIRIAWANDGEIRNCVFRDLVMRDTTVGITLVLPIAGGWNRYDYGREATSVHDLLFENIEMKEIYGRPIYSFIESAEKGTRCAGVRDVTFRNVRARALELPLWCGRADVPTRNIVYDRCAFTKVSDDELPGYRRHGAFWDRFPGRTDTFTENFTTNASSFRVVAGGER